MNDRNLLRGVLFIAISLGFGLQALTYPIGEFSHAGAGLFPLLISGLLMVIGLLTVARARFIERVPMHGGLKNIALILLSLGGFALLSQFVNMIVGIIFMVFCSGFAAATYSIPRNIKIAASLIVVAWGFQRLLGLHLPLY
jgi:hypothetical protein